MLLLSAALPLAHSLSEVVRPVNTTTMSAARPCVLLFFHVGKCGGTTVRGIFHGEKWATTYWSMTQRFEGWKANRILNGIRGMLGKNLTRIFVEWHLGGNFSAVDDIRTFVRVMRPDVDLRAFLILRPAEEVASANGAFFEPNTRPDFLLRKNREFLLFNMLDLGRPFEVELARRVMRRHGREGEALPPVDLSGNATWRTRPQLLCQPNLNCGDPEDPIVAAALPPINASHECAVRSPLCDEYAQDLAAGTWRRGAARLRDVQARHVAQTHVMVEQLARLERIVDAFGCAPLVERALQRLSQLDALMFLEDPRTYQTVQRMARWTGVGASPSLQRDPSDETFYPTPKTATTAWSAKMAYQTKNITALAVEMNRCSMKLYAELKRRYGATFTYDGR